MNLNRRLFLHAGLMSGAALAFAPRAMAETTMPDWHIGYETAPGGGLRSRSDASRRQAGRPDRHALPEWPGAVQTWRRLRDALVRWRWDGPARQHRHGKAVHTGRYVATKKRQLEMAADKFLAPGFGTVGDLPDPVSSSDDVNPGNISVLVSGGELLALWEAGSAYRLDPVTLETRGFKTWRNDLKGMPFLAHPKREPDGRVWNLAINRHQIGIFNINRGWLDRRVRHGRYRSPPLTSTHWAMTDRKLIILCQPWIQTKNQPPFIDGFQWKPEQGMKFLIIDKDDLSKTRWAQGPARSFYHTGSAWEEADGTTRLDAAFYPEPILGSGGGGRRNPRQVLRRRGQLQTHHGGHSAER